MIKKKYEKHKRNTKPENILRETECNKQNNCKSEWRVGFAPKREEDRKK